MPKCTWQYGLLIVLAFLFENGQAQNTPEGYVLSKNLKSDWVIYNSRQKTYAPYVTNTPFTASEIAFSLKKEETQQKSLELCLQKGSSLFINESICCVFESEECRIFDLDSLFAMIDQREIFIAVYHPSLNADGLNTRLFSSRTALGNAEEEVDLESLKRGKESTHNFFIVLIFLILSVFAALLNIFPKTFSVLYGFDWLYHRTRADDAFVKLRLLSSESLLVLGGHAMILAFVVMYFVHNVPYLMRAMPIFHYAGLINAVFLWFLLSIFVLIFILLKFFSIKVIAGAFRLDAFANFHFFDFIRLSLIFYAGLAAIVGLVYLADIKNIIGISVLTYFIVGFSVLRVLFLYFKLLRSTSLKNLYLFSYLCTTEIFPLIVGLKIFLK